MMPAPVPTPAPAEAAAEPAAPPEPQATGSNFRQRLQKLFEKYDTNGDGTLSEEEMAAVFVALGIKKEKAEALFKAADADQDGVIQVHEFISWLTAQRNSVKILKLQDEDGQIYQKMVATNTNDRRGRKFTLNFTKCQNMEFPEGNPVEFDLKPGEQKEMVVMRVQCRPWRWNFRWSTKSVFTGIEDDLSNAFVDEDFPHAETSVGKTSTRFKVGTAERWVRARALGDPSECILFDQVRPQDVKQGSLGDCWLMSALSCMAEYPQKLKSLFKENHLTEDGKYGVYLFDIEKEEWTVVTVDEFLPCNVRYGKPSPVFAKPLGDEIWVSLLEKAFAKYCGNYGTLSGGGCAWAFQVLSGKVAVVSYQRLDNGNWRFRRINRKGQLRRGARNPRCCTWTWNNKAPVLDTDKLFDALSSHCADKHILGCSIGAKGDKAEEAKSNGLYTRHVYSMLSASQEEKDDGTPVRLVKLRNPWGHKEWTGAWADMGDESEWKDNPKLQEKLASTKKNDGCFYMPFEDWVKHFTFVALCPVGVAPIPPPEEAEEQEMVEEDEKSDEEQAYISSDRED